MNALIQQLVADAPVVLDGAWGTQLQSRGLEAGDCPEAWNLTNVEAVEAVVRDYVEAGSRIVLTNTFGASRLMLAAHGLEAQAARINRRGAEASRRAAGNRAKVFASIGPSGKLLLTGEVTEDALREAFTQQARALADGGADAIVIETMSDLTEAGIALDAARETGLPVVACMVYDSGADKDRTMMGVTPEQSAEALTQGGADVIGANCGQGIAGFIPICKRLRAATDRPIWIKANAGLPEIVDGRATYRITAEEFASHGPALVEAGASFVGGCCGTGPAFIQALRKEIRP